MSFSYTALLAKDQAISKKPVFQKGLSVGFQAGVQIYSSRRCFLIYTIFVARLQNGIRLDFEHLLVLGD